MAKKRKKKVFRAVQAVKELARERIGAPPSARVVPDLRKKSRAEKRKRTLDQLLDEL